MVLVYAFFFLSFLIAGGLLIRERVEYFFIYLLAALGTFCGFMVDEMSSGPTEVYRGVVCRVHNRSLYVRYGTAGSPVYRICSQNCDYGMFERGDRIKVEYQYGKYTGTEYIRSVQLVQPWLDPQ